MALYGLGLAYHHKHLPEQGFKEFQKALEVYGSEAAAIMLMGVNHAIAGDRKAAEKELTALRGLSKQKYVPSLYSAFIYSVLGDLDRAFESLERACKERSSYLIFLNVQPSLNNLRSDPRYQDLVTRIGLK